MAWQVSPYYIFIYPSWSYPRWCLLMSSIKYCRQGLSEWSVWYLSYWLLSLWANHTKCLYKRHRCTLIAQELSIRERNSWQSPQPPLSYLLVQNKLLLWYLTVILAFLNILLNPSSSFCYEVDLWINPHTVQRKTQILRFQDTDGTGWTDFTDLGAA